MSEEHAALLKRPPHAPSSNAAVEQLFVSILKTLANSLETKDPYTHGHSRRVAAHAVRVARRLGLSRAEAEQVELAGLFHDIGKIGVREAVLHKPGPLTREEYEHVRTHPELGERILRPLRGAFSFAAEGRASDGRRPWQFAPILECVRHHHERFDGRGYPDGCRNGAISVGARMLAVCDAYDAMTSRRPYRPPLPPEEALDEIDRGRGSQFDPLVADTFLHMHREQASR